MNPVDQLDAVWRQYQAKEIAWTYAVQAIRRIANVTVEGARDLLASDIAPSERY